MSEVTGQMKLSVSTSTAGGESPGLGIRAVRLGLGLTLAEVSARTGLAISTLSKLEIGRVALSYEKLLLISKALGVDIAGLVDPRPEGARTPSRSGGRRSVQRAGEGRIIETGSYRQVHLATEILNKKMTPIIVEIRSHSLEAFIAEYGGLISHPGEEFALVLEGELEFHSDLYTPLRLKEGDSIYFDSDMGHAYLNTGDRRCRLICSCAPSADEMTTQLAAGVVKQRGLAANHQVIDHLATPRESDSSPRRRKRAGRT